MTATTTTSGLDLDTILHEPELRPFLPLLYVAWADGDVDDGQRDTIRARVAATPWLKPRLRLAIEAWLTTTTPPDAVSLARVRTAIVAAAHTMSPEGLQSFSALAASLGAVDDVTRAVVDDLERELGVVPQALHLQRVQPVEDRFTSAMSFAPSAVRALLDGRFAKERDRVRTFLEKPEHRAMYGVDKQRHREQVYAWLKELATDGFGALAYPGEVWRAVWLVGRQRLLPRLA